MRERFEGKRAGFFRSHDREWSYEVRGSVLYKAGPERGIMTEGKVSVGVTKRFFTGFIAGFFATLIFHQLALGLLWLIELTPARPFSMVQTNPFGVPAVFSLALWGGVWGMLYGVIEDHFPDGFGYWVFAFLFGAFLPSLVALTIVLPLKGRPMGGGWHPPLLLTAFLINGAWGIGTGLILGLLHRRIDPTAGDS